MPSISKENYLKEIYELCNDEVRSVSTLALAQKLNITNAATSDMAKGLLKKGLINYKKYKGVSLTPKGTKIAVNIIRRHRLWELFLVQSLGLGWEEVHDEAENLEHQTSEYLIDKIDDHLGNPKFDPHGKPIPNKNGSIPHIDEQISLNSAKVNERYIVMRVNDESQEVMGYFTEIGLKLNTEIKVLKILDFDKSVTIDMHGKKYSFSEKLSSKIFLTLVSG